MMIQAPATRDRRLTDVLLVLEPLHEAIHLAERRVPHGCWGPGQVGVYARLGRLRRARPVVGGDRGGAVSGQLIKSAVHACRSSRFFGCACMSRFRPATSTTWRGRPPVIFSSWYPGSQVSFFAAARSPPGGASLFLGVLGEKRRARERASDPFHGINNQSLAPNSELNHRAVIHGIHRFQFLAGPPAAGFDLRLCGVHIDEELLLATAALRR